MPVAWLLAFVDLTAIEETSRLVIRVVLAVIAAVVGWFVGGPLTRLVYRVLVRRQTPGPVVFLGRLGSAALAAVLVYTLATFGLGLGWGWGPGPGGGPGLGPGLGGSPGTGTGAGEGKASKPGDEEARREALVIEMAHARSIPKDSERYYLIQGQEPPKTLKDVQELLQKDKGRWSRLEILIHPDSPARGSAPVQQLTRVAEKAGLSWNIVVRKE
jgi:hypothetical protein